MQSTYLARLVLTVLQLLFQMIRSGERTLVDASSVILRLSQPLSVSAAL